MIAAPLLAHATVLEAWDTARLVRESAAVVEAVVLERRAVSPDGKNIFTDTRLEIRRYLFGSGSKTLWVRQLGGKLGDRWMHVPGTPALTVGQELILFLAGTGERRYVAGMAQGAYELIRESKGTSVRRVFPEREMSLADLEQEIRNGIAVRR